jgi:hypothetical protein
VAAADNAGTLKLKMLVMENIKMVFYHPKKYKELHGLTSLKCNTRQRSLGGLPVNGALNSDQVISESSRDGESERAPGPGQQHQATSSKHQASSVKLKETQASSGKHQAPSTKRQA